jgi:AhpD family alkylhydroperoxidase
MTDEETRKEMERRLRRQEEFYGFQPFLTNFLSQYPDLFLAYTDLSGRLLVEPKHLSLKEMELASVSAGAALGSEYCLNVHIVQALKVGATKEEVVEAMMIGALMTMTRGLSTSFRKLADLEDK